MTTVDTDKARAWVTKRRGIWHQVYGTSLYFWHHWVPKFFSAKFTILSVLGFAFVALINLAIILAPAWSKVLTDQGLDFGKVEAAQWFSGVIVACLMLLRWVSEKAKESKKNAVALAKNRELLSFAQMKLFETLRPVVNRASVKKLKEAERQIALDAVLKCIDCSALVATNQDTDGYFSVSLYLFHGATGDTADLLARSRPGRDTRAGLNSSGLVAYYAAELGREFAVHDFKWQPVFPFLRPGTNEAPPYRSILFVPVVDNSQPATRALCKAVVTVDSAVPFEFWGRRMQGVAAEIQPYLRLLNLLLSHHEHGVSRGG